MTDCDVVVIGAGLSGITALHRLRKTGLSVTCFEAGSGLGGVWFWNRYPGARVDNQFPYYQLNIPEVYGTWNWSEKFPGREELCEYIAHIDKTLGLSKDVHFNSRVNDISWDVNTCQWRVKTEQGHQCICKYLMICTGICERPYCPQFPGLSKFRGPIYHSRSWPGPVSFADKNVLLIGCGASGVQITQEVGKEAAHLDVLIRHPPHCVPMRQRDLTIEEQDDMRIMLPDIFHKSRNSFAGFLTKQQSQNTFDVDEAQRQAIWENGHRIGSFNYFITAFPDNMLDKKANRAYYDFWVRKTRLRLTDPKKQAVMCPDEPTHTFLGKRPPLEQDYYEVLNQSNVDIHDVRSNPIQSFNEDGVSLADGTSLKTDVVILATGFDAWTGNITNMGLTSKDGLPLETIWTDHGIGTYLGLTIPGFPNLFACYTPQSPAAVGNGPTVIEMQVEIVVDMIKTLEDEKIRTIEAKKSAADEWGAMVDGIAKMTLYPLTDSWWNGGNIPGRKPQNLTFFGGLDTYEKRCRAAMENWDGYDITHSAVPAS